MDKKYIQLDKTKKRLKINKLSVFRSFIPKTSKISVFSRHIDDALFS